MIIQAKNIRNFIVLVLVFIIGGILHIVTRPYDMFDCFSQVYFGVFVLAWGISSSQRIINVKVRRLLYMMICWVEIYFLLQICNYRLAGGTNRYIWFAYYIPMLVIPLLFFYASLYMNQYRDDHIDHKWLLVTVPVVIIIGLILTNDYHELFCKLENLSTDITLSNAGIVFFLHYICIVSLLVSAIVIMIRKCRLAISKPRMWILVATVFISLSMFILHMLGIRPGINGVSFWNIGEIYAFTFIFIWEMCIQVGLIPANTNYQWFFKETKIPAIIMDSTDKPVHVTSGVDSFSSPSIDMHIESAPVTGGSVSWIVDHSVVNELNLQIENATEQIESRNNYLKTQNALMEESATVNARNKVYDRIATKAQKQLHKIDELLSEGDESTFTDRLKKIIVFNTYIKRRGNFELLKESNEIIPVSELTTAILESLEYLKLNNIEVAFNTLISGNVFSDTAITIYEFFEEIIELIIDKKLQISIILSQKESMVILRVIINSIDLNTKSLMRENVTVQYNDDDTIVVLSVVEGGDTK